MEIVYVILCNSRALASRDSSLLIAVQHRSAQDMVNACQSQFASAGVRTCLSACAQHMHEEVVLTWLCALALLRHPW